MAVLDPGLAASRRRKLRSYYPTDVLVTGFDIIFFWVARMMMMGLEFMGKEPFHTVYVHALVRDEQGAKMSKTKGNVIDPLKLVDEYGADATRFTLAAMAAQGRDMRLAMSRVEGYRNFVTKLWNAARFLEMNGCVRRAGYRPARTTSSRSTAGSSAPRRAPSAAVHAARSRTTSSTKPPTPPTISSGAPIATGTSNWPSRS